MIPERLNAGAFVAAMLFGSSVVAVQEVPPLSLAVLRFGQGGLLLLCVLLLIGRQNVLRVKWHDLPLLLLLGAILFAVFPVTFNASLRLIRGFTRSPDPGHDPDLERVASSGGHERAAGVPTGRRGLSLPGWRRPGAHERGLDWRSGLGTLAGDALMLVTALCGAAYGVLAQRAFARYSALTVTTYAMVLGTLLLLPGAVAEDLVGVQLDRQTVALLVFLGVFGGAIGFFLIRLTPTQVAVYINLNPLVAMVLAAAPADSRH